jgi:N-acetylmuramoyl-L-alanine amidase
VVQAFEREGVVYVSVDDLSLLLRISFHWWSDLGKVTLDLPGAPVWVIEGSEIARIGEDRSLQMPGPAFLWGGRLQVPLALVVDETGRARPWTGVDLDFDREARTLSAEARALTTVREARLAPGVLGWKLVVTADGPLEPRILRSERASFVVSIPGVDYDPLLLDLPLEHPWFQGLRFRPEGRDLVVVFAAGPGAVGWTLDRSRGGQEFELILGFDERDLREGTLREFELARATLPTELRTVVLDPGHGGGRRGEAGAADRTPREMEEGSLAHTIASQVARELAETYGLQVVLTRDPFSDPPADVRIERANHEGGDLYLSLHVHHRAGGPAAFVARVPTEVTPVPPELDRLGFRAFREGQEPLLAASRRVARNVVQGVAEALDTPALGVYEESLTELQGALMPAVMLEIPLGEEGLTPFQIDRIVEGILAGLPLPDAKDDSGDDEEDRR